ncbi:MAG: YeiH family protein [Gaiellales bacterium]
MTLDSAGARSDAVAAEPSDAVPAEPGGALSAPAAERRRLAMVLAAVPGLGVVLVVTAAAIWLARLLPLAGAPVLAIALGALTTAVLRPGPWLRAGSAFASKQLLQVSIVLLGTGLSLSQVAQVGRASLPVMLGTLAAALCGAWLFGRLLGVDADTRVLIGAGTGICGASAIASVTAVLGAAESKVAYAMGTIFTFNIVSVLAYPTLGSLLGLSQHAFGLWSGTAINDTSSVAAAAYTYGSAAGDYAVVVKLTRSLMIIPICAALAVLQVRRQSRAAGARQVRVPWRKTIPLFILGFLAASALETVGAVPAGWHRALTSIGMALITAALAGIGLTTRLATLRTAGPRPLALGAILWATVGVTSLLLQAGTGSLT